MNAAGKHSSGSGAGRRKAPPPGKDAADVKVVCRNRRARERYTVERTFEAGIELLGTEVKALRDGEADIADAYAVLQDGQVVLLNFHIAPYKSGGYVNHAPRRPRRLLLHRREIKRLIGRVAERGNTLIPLTVYFKKGWAKVELALAKGKATIDRREEIRKRDVEREERQGGRR
ncbi:MAG: SsrA-binding protein SmpB [Deltaproteobacteria bacterium]|nr:SsrA-binding protein SmpB [Deltaproteobacteria bacterium]